MKWFKNTLSRKPGLLYTILLANMFFALALPATAASPAVETPGAKAEIGLSDFTESLNCVGIQDQALRDRISAIFQANSSRQTAKALGTNCAFDEHEYASLLLVGVGTVVIGITQDSYEELMKYQHTSGNPATLFINGVDLGLSGVRVGTQMSAEQVLLKYRIEAGSGSETLWRSLYAAGGLTDVHPLHVELGWKNEPVIGENPMHKPEVRIALTDSFTINLAAIAIAVLLFLTTWLVIRFDLVRDTMPDWYAEALRIQSQLTEQGYPPDNDSINSYFNLTGDNSLPVSRDRYQDAASAAVRGNLQFNQDKSGNAEIIKDAQIGLAGGLVDTRKIRSTYSLARLQLMLWFAFTVYCAIYLWIVFGELPPIAGSMLVLLGISAGTAATSVAIDRSAKRQFTPSAGMIKDISTGFKNDKEQVHRYQSIVVNLLLLFAGLIHVTSNLSFPTFDQTWLFFLGFSGLTYAAGKQLTESKEDPTGTSNLPVTS